MNFTCLASLGGIGPEEHEFLSDEDIPIFLLQNWLFIPDVHSTVSDMTLTAELSPKFVASMYFCPLG